MMLPAPSRAQPCASATRRACGARCLACAHPCSFPRIAATHPVREEAGGGGVRWFAGASAAVATGLLVLPSRPASAAAIPLAGPVDLAGGATLGFDDDPAGSVVNELYLGRGIAFARDDVEAIPLSDWSRLGRSTPSPRNVLATIKVPGLNTNWATHLELHASTPLVALGAWFGNDQVLPFFPAGDFAAIRLTVFDALGEALGSVSVDANHNTSVDQFVGLRSDVPFVRARFENLDATGQPTVYYGVVLDDLSFLPVPEPSTGAALGCALLGLGWVARRGRRRRRRS